jgi:SAM-dependent methyltransferase
MNAAATPGSDDGYAFTQRLLRAVPMFRVIVRAAECRLFAEIDLPGPVLDIGCGDGTFAYAFAPETTWYAIEPAIKPLTIAKDLHVYRSVFQSEGARLPFKDESFGSVVSNSTLEHIPDVEAVLRDMYRVLRPGGTFAVSFPSEMFYDYYAGTRLFTTLRLRPLAALYRRWVKYTARVKHADPPDIWRRRLESLGLSIQSWRYYYSRNNTTVMDAWHYLSGPSVITHKLLRRWNIWPGKVDVFPVAHWIEPWTRPGASNEGSFLLFVCRKPAV